MVSSDLTNRATLGPRGPSSVPVPEGRQRRGSLLGVGSLVLGIAAVGWLITLCVAFSASCEAKSQSYVSLQMVFSFYSSSVWCSVAGLVVGIVAIGKKGGARFWAIAGVILNGLVLGVLMVFLALALQIK